jgi:hypothetical protein
MELALQIARTPDDQISALMPQIAELREIAESIELKRENSTQRVDTILPSLTMIRSTTS